MQDLVNGALLKIAILTIFPNAFEGFLDTGLLKKAIDTGLIEIDLCDIRKFASPPHYKVDDEPYGGGAGMVMMAPPIIKCVESIKERLTKAKVLLMTPSGKRLDQNMVEQLAKERELIIICGRYEGVDERVVESVVDEEISIGDYVLMGGEVPSMVVIEALARLIPGVIGNPASLKGESFQGSRLSHPQYTRPREYRGMVVPDVLLSGDRASIKRWREEQAINKTKKNRPELLKKEK